MAGLLLLERSLCFRCLCGVMFGDTFLIIRASRHLRVLPLAFSSYDVRAPMIGSAMLLLRRAVMNGVHDPCWTGAVGCLRRCCIGHRPGRWFQSFGYFLRIRLALDYIDHFPFPFSGLQFQFHFPRFTCPPRGLTKTSLAMIGFAPALPLSGPSVRRGFRFGLEVWKHLLSKRR